MGLKNCKESNTDGSFVNTISGFKICSMIGLSRRLIGCTFTALSVMERNVTCVDVIIACVSRNSSSRARALPSPANDASGRSGATTPSSLGINPALLYG
nr:hypothetical protein CFP56_02792 [Quercus suber]